MLAVAGERVGRKALTSDGPLQVAVGDVAEAVLPAGIEDGGAEVGHAGGVGVGFSGDVEAAPAGADDYLQRQRGFMQAGAGDVNDMEGRAGGGVVGEDFLDRIDGAGFLRAAGAHVDVDRGHGARRQGGRRRGSGPACT